MAGPDSERLATALCHVPPVSRTPSGWAEVVPAETFVQLVEHGFLVPDHIDEVEIIRRRYWAAREGAPVSLTIATTMDCNLGCYYCYEERSEARLVSADVPTLLALARDKLAKATKKSLHVAWYGGEPLLNLPFLDTASIALQELCATLGVHYHASVVSNGTLWPEDVAGFVSRHKVRQVQISFDGLRAHHDKRRRYRRGYSEDADASSFHIAVELVDHLLDCVHVDVRFNIDRGNVSDFVPFLQFARERGWFDRPFPAVIQPARLSRFSDHSEFMRQQEFDVAEFEEIRASLRAAAGEHVRMMTCESPEGFPVPRTSVCGALAVNSVVVGAEGALYRCGLQVGETQRAVGRITGGRRLPLLHGGEDDSAFWSAFDPTKRPRCSGCSFLPICWGGCPKRHLERDAHALLEQGEYWRRRLAGLVAEGVGDTLRHEVVYAEADQFRLGAPAAPCDRLTS